MPQTKSVIGTVFERKPGPSSPSSPKLKATRLTGFPPVQHRSKSLFAQSRTQHTTEAIKPPVPPIVIPASTAPDDYNFRRQISDENELKVAELTEEEREQARAEILERFGPAVGDVLKRARESRERQMNADLKTAEAESVDSQKEKPRSDVVDLAEGT